MQKDRYIEHKKIIKYMKKLNKDIMNDAYLGLNRFRIDLYSENWSRYGDGSGGYLTLVFKMTDKKTNNSAMFIANNYNFVNNMNIYMNDFLIRCSHGSMGHFPALNYIAYDVHTIVSYDGDTRKHREPEEGIIKTYNWLKKN